MIKHNAVVPLKYWSMFLGLAVLSLHLPVQAQVKPTDPTLSASLLAQVTFTPPPGKRRSRTSSSGGASRQGEDCPQEESLSEEATSVSKTRPPLTLLVPSDVVALTHSERPTLLAYIPNTSGQTVFFSLSDPQGSYYYQTLLSLPASAGVIQIKVPADAPPLAVGQQYQWSLVMACGPTLRPDSPWVSGEIERVALNVSLTQQLAGQTPLQQARLLGREGIWYDTLANLAAARQQQPQDPDTAQSWQQILAGAGLESIATAPILDP